MGRPDRQAGSEDQAAVAPHVTGRESSPGLLDPVPLECLHRDLWQRQRGIRGRRLRVPPQQRPVDLLDLPRNERLATGQVDVLQWCSYAWGLGKGTGCCRRSGVALGVTTVPGAGVLGLPMICGGLALAARARAAI